MTGTCIVVIQVHFNFLKVMIYSSLSGYFSVIESTDTLLPVTALSKGENVVINNSSAEV